MKKLKNYSSSSKNSFDVITKCLAAHNAKKIMFEYDNGRAVALSFSLDIQGKEIIFKMPARIDRVVRLMYKDNIDERGGITIKELEQGYKTGWANIRDWITAQMAIIDTQMVDIDEVFLPYRVRGDGQTNYDAAKSNNHLLG